MDAYWWAGKNVLEQVDLQLPRRPKALELSETRNDVRIQKQSTQSAKMDSTVIRTSVLQVFYDTVDAELVSETVSLDSLGFDSIGVVDLRNSLANVTGVELDPAIIMGNPCVGEIIETITA